MKLKSYIWFLSQAPLPALLLISAVAWLLLWLGGHQHVAPHLPAAAAQLMHHHHQPVPQAAPVTAQVDALATLAQLSSWALMVLAMMFPLLHNAIRHIWQRSLPRLRLLGSALFCLGYFLLWLLFGYFSNGLLRLGQIQPGWQVAAGMALLAIIWQASPWKQWA